MSDRCLACGCGEAGVTRRYARLDAAFCDARCQARFQRAVTGTPLGVKGVKGGKLRDDDSSDSDTSSSSEEEKLMRWPKKYEVFELDYEGRYRAEKTDVFPRLNFVRETHVAAIYDRENAHDDYGNATVWMPFLREYVGYTGREKIYGPVWLFPKNAAVKFTNSERSALGRALDAESNRLIDADPYYMRRK